MEPLIKEQSSESEKLIENVKKVYRAVLKDIASGQKVVGYERDEDLHLMNTQLSEIDERSGIFNRSLIVRTYRDIFKPDGTIEIVIDAQHFGTSRFAQAKFSYLPKDSDKHIISDTFDDNTTNVTILLNLDRIINPKNGSSQTDASHIFKSLPPEDYISILRSAILAGSFIIIQDRKMITIVKKV